MLLSAPPPPAWMHEAAAAGRGELVVSLGVGRSVTRRAFATSPLRWLTPANHGRAAWVYASSYGGGLVNGDALSMDIQVEPGASAYVSTQASTKVYRSPRGTTMDTRARVAPGALLVLAPDPVVCFSGSRYRQTQEFEVDPAAGLVLVDWVTSGRREAGERWAFDDYTSRIVVRLDGRRLLHEATALRATDGSLPSRFGRFDVLAVVVVAGGALSAHASALVARLTAGPTVKRAECLVAAAPLGEGGAIVRIAGRSVEQVSRVVRDALVFVPALLEDDPWKRKW